jgi:cytochrome c biogenesis protein CcdA
METLKRELRIALITAPINIPVGFVIVFLILAVFIGSISDTFSLILLSIICTAGISLILWLPIWYVTGYLCVIPFRLLVKALDVNLPITSTPPQQPAAQTPPSGAQAQSLSRDQAAVTNYIKKAKAKGLNKESITRALQANGWTLDSINSAFQRVEQEV